MVLNGPDADIRPGNHLPLSKIPVGTQIHNIELPSWQRRTNGESSWRVGLMAREGRYAQVRLPSGESRLVLVECGATIGQVGNTSHELVIGKAGRTRWLGRRPHQRGVSMNPVDHPHGGGEGRTSGGRHPYHLGDSPRRVIELVKINARTSSLFAAATRNNGAEEYIKCHVLLKRDPLLTITCTSR